MAETVAQSAENWKDRLDKALHEKNCCTDVLEQLESKTGVKRLYWVLGGAVFLGLYLMVGYGSDFLCNFIGFLYPAYASVKAIESKEKDDDTKWLTYWVVYSVFALVEFFADIFLFWIPFYWFLKCVFLIYCFAPTSYNGSVMLYTKVIRPYVLKYEKQADSAIDKATAFGKQIYDQGGEVVRDVAGEAAKKYVSASKQD